MRILHVFRAPVGGLFRHVRDLAGEQARAGHEVGVICDSGTGGPMADRLLRDLEPSLVLGVRRLSMPRYPGPADLAALGRIRDHIDGLNVDIVHGHGAKGGLYARLARGAAKAVYTAHGGSLHYDWKTPQGALFLGAERLLLSRTDGIIFVCEYERRTLERKIGRPACPHAVIHNGLTEEEFTPAEPERNAADVLFVGEMRRLKGVDVLIEALDMLRAGGREVRALLVGDGPDRRHFREMIRERGLQDLIEMPGAMPAREAFAKGRLLVVPSRAESFPYIVLEAQAAALPLIATDVGGIGEMTLPEMLVPPEDPQRLAERISEVLDDPRAHEKALSRMSWIRERFSVARMAEKALDFYERIPGR